MCSPHSGSAPRVEIYAGKSSELVLYLSYAPDNDNKKGRMPLGGRREGKEKKSLFLCRSSSTPRQLTIADLQGVSASFLAILNRCNLN